LRGICIERRGSEQEANKRQEARAGGDEQSGGIKAENVNVATYGDMQERAGRLRGRQGEELNGTYIERGRGTLDVTAAVREKNKVLARCTLPVFLVLSREKTSRRISRVSSVA
jgi:hypothetical protein